MNRQLSGSGRRLQGRRLHHRNRRRLTPMGQPSARSSQRRRRQPAPSGRRLPLRPALLGRQGLEHLPASRLGAFHPCHHHRRRPNPASCHLSQGCHRRPPGRLSRVLERCRSRALARQRSQPLGHHPSHSSGNLSPSQAMARRLRCSHRASLSRRLPRQGLVERRQDLTGRRRALGRRSRAMARHLQAMARRPKNVLA